MDVQQDFGSKRLSSQGKLVNVANESQNHGHRGFETYTGKCDAESNKSRRQAIRS